MRVVVARPLVLKFECHASDDFAILPPTHSNATVELNSADVVPPSEEASVADGSEENILDGVSNASDDDDTQRVPTAAQKRLLKELGSRNAPGGKRALLSNMTEKNTLLTIFACCSQKPSNGHCHRETHAARSGSCRRTRSAIASRCAPLISSC
jgi:hypothetical protein